MELRPVSFDDPLVGPLLEGLAEEYGRRYGSTDEMALAAAHEFEPPGGTFLVLVEDGRTIAGGGIRRLSGDTCEVKRMWTSPAHRNMGHASRVLTALETEAARLGYRRIRLETGCLQPEAIALYQKVGYQPIPPYGPYPDDLAFERDLAPPFGAVSPVTVKGVHPRGPTPFDGDRYQARFDALEASGAHVHGEADLVELLRPSTVLDVGCGTGRVAIELARRGIEVVGVDADPSMLAVARSRQGEITWIQADMTTLELARRFSLVLMAGNVPLFTAPGTEGALVARCAAHLAPGGLLVAGFQLGRGYQLFEYDAHATAAGLLLEARYASWDRAPYEPSVSDYAVSLHRAA